MSKAGVWYLAAASADADAATGAGTGAGTTPMVYRVARVTTAEILAEEFTRPPDFDLAAWWGRWSDSFMTSRPKLEVVVRASADAIAVFPEVFGDVVRAAVDAAPPADEHGFREVTLTFEHEAAAVQRLAGFGGRVQVLSPPGVRARLIATARELLRCYGEPGGRATVIGRG